MDRKLIDNNFRKANDQLLLIDCKKSKIKKEIYSLYELYLKCIRSKLNDSLIEAILSLIELSNNEISNKEISNNENSISLFIEKQIKNKINEILPFLTIEQLSFINIIETNYFVDENIEFKNNYYLEEEIYEEKDFRVFHNFESILYCYGYYDDVISEDQFLNFGLNENKLEDINYKDSFKENILDQFNSFISFEIEEEKQSTIKFVQNYEENIFMPFEFKEIIKWLDTLDSSLDFYLKRLSFEINKQLFKNKLLTKYINKDLLFYISENNSLFNNPLPFVLLFDLSLNQFVNLRNEEENNNEYSKIYLLNIDSTELEFSSINLSNLRNKILDMKLNINLLIKKENYWNDKIKTNLNNQSLINKI